MSPLIKTQLSSFFGSAKKKRALIWIREQSIVTALKKYWLRGSRGFTKLREIESLWRYPAIRQLRRFES